MTYWSVSYNPNAGKHNAELRAERQKSEQTMKDSIEVSRKKREEQAKKYEGGLMGAWPQNVKTMLDIVKS